MAQLEGLGHRGGGERLGGWGLGVGGFALLANEVLHNRFGFTWPSWEHFVWGVVVGTWGVGCFVLLADEVINNRSGYIKLLLGRSWPSWPSLITGVVMGVWGVGLFVLFTREVLHNGFGFVAGDLPKNDMGGYGHRDRVRRLGDWDFRVVGNWAASVDSRLVIGTETRQRGGVQEASAVCIM